MSDFEFQIDWESPMGVRGEELRATWARLQINVHDEAVTRLNHLKDRSFRDYVYGPVYPIAEWLVMNWWCLFGEVDTPGLHRSNSYARRHCLSAASEGFALPNLAINPSGYFTVLSWQPSRKPSASVEFTASGSELLPTATVRESIRGFIYTVISRLESAGINETPLQLDWQAIQAAEGDEVEFCQLAAALGEDPYAMDETSCKRLVSAASGLPQSILNELFAAVDFADLESNAVNIREILEHVQRVESTLSLPTTLKGKLQFRGATMSPWDQGYHVARELRNLLSINDQLLNNDGVLSEALKMNSAALEKSVISPGNGGWGFDALSASQADGKTLIVTAKNRPNSRRFTICRALFDPLTNPGLDRATLVSRASSESQQANRAFAAEFLAPAGMLRQRVCAQVVEDEQIEDLASEFGVSSMVIRHQFENHRIAEIL